MSSKENPKDDSKPGKEAEKPSPQPTEEAPDSDDTSWCPDEEDEDGEPPSPAPASPPKQLPKFLPLLDASELSKQGPLFDDDPSSEHTESTCPETPSAPTSQLGDLRDLLHYESEEEVVFFTPRRRLSKKLSGSMEDLKEATSKLTASMKDTAVDGAKQIKKLVSRNNEHTWKELLKIEKKRREILKRSNLPMHKMLLYWRGTVLSALSKDPIFYLIMGIYVWTRLMSRYSDQVPEFVATLGGAPVEVVGGFLSFFLIFYVNTAYKRFDDLYRSSMACEGRIYGTAALARSSLPRAQGLRLIRYMNAVHITGYVGLSDTYNYENFFTNNNAKAFFLTSEELQRIVTLNMDAGGSTYRELITWCCNEVTSAVREGLIDDRLAMQFRDQILDLRTRFARLYDYEDQPVSFYYVHFIGILSAIYLPLLALQSGLDAGAGDNVYWLNDVLSGLTVMLQGMFIIGLRLLAAKLAHPYGDEVENLSVIHYVNDTWRMSMRMLEAEMPSPVNAEKEEEMCKQQTGIDGYAIGEAWRPQQVKGVDSC